MKTKIKTLGQVYTPKWIVNEILDNINYNNESILNKYILEPSCGDGVFLEEIINRYISMSFESNISIENIITNLEHYIYAFEIDHDEYKKTINRLNLLVKELLGFDVNIKWNIFNSDTMSLYKDYINFFDFVVGNPPYIRIHNISDDNKEMIKKEFMFTNGSLDMYIIFFELGINMLKEDGKLGYITPNTYFRNLSHKKFRNFLKENKLIETIIDFKSNKIFKKFSTYTAITILSKNNNDFFNYKELVESRIILIDRIYYDKLNNKKWIFLNEHNKNFINELNLNKDGTISELFDVKYGFATLRDKIFISKKVEKYDDNNVYFNGTLIERNLLNRIVKVSKFKGDVNDTEYILFPYYLDNNRYKVIPEDILKERYPLAYGYLLSNKEELLKRDIEKGMVWYEFGRSQGIQTMNNEKIIVNPMVGDKLKFFKIPSDIFAYSGIFIIKNKPYSNWDIIEDVLDSIEFLNFIKITGKDLSGGFKSVTSKHIKEFKIKL